MLQDYAQYSSQQFGGVAVKEDAAAAQRARREAERRAQDRFCPECSVQVGAQSTI